MLQTEKRIENDTLTEQIIGSAIQLHRELGPGLLESSYGVCLSHELPLSGLTIERQKIIPIFYRGIKLDAGYRIDLVVEGQVIVEIKAVLALLPVHEAQAFVLLETGRRRQRAVNQL